MPISFPEHSISNDFAVRCSKSATSAECDIRNGYPMTTLESRSFFKYRFQHRNNHPRVMRIIKQIGTNYDIKES